MLPPWRLYLTALEVRFSSTCWSRWRSAWTVEVDSGGGGGGVRAARSPAGGAMGGVVSFRASWTSPASGDNARWPLSMRSRSSTSLMRPSRSRPARRRGAQLVAHARRELALGGVGPVGVLLGLQRRRGSPLSLMSSDSVSRLCRLDNCARRRPSSSVTGGGSVVPLPQELLRLDGEGMGDWRPSPGCPPPRRGAGPPPRGCHAAPRSSPPPCGSGRSRTG